MRANRSAGLVAIAVAVAAIALRAPAATACDPSIMAALDEKHVDDAHQLPPSEGPFDSHNVAMLGRLRIADIGALTTRATNVWGYASPGGREYAILGLSDGTAFVDVTDPGTPALVEVIDHPAACCSDVKTYLHYAFSVSEGPDNGLQIIDMEFIDDGIVTLADTFRGADLTRAHTLFINEESGYAYLCGARNNPSNAGLFVVDVRDPLAASFVGTWPNTYVHECQVVTYTSGPYAGREIAFLYTGLFDSQLRIIDVTNKSDIRLIGSATYPNAEFTHQGWLSEDRRYVYVNDEFDEINNHTTTSTIVINVADIEAPFYVKRFGTGLPSTDHNLMVKGDFLYEANYTSGLRIFRVHSPSFPVQVGWFDTHPASDETGFHGAWGVYTGLPSGNILVSDIENGLFVFDVSDALASVQEDLPVSIWPGMTLMALIIIGAGVFALGRRDRACSESPFE